MARYPIKMLRDEEGQPFVPLTHIDAVQGMEYSTVILEAQRESKGHYKIVNTDIDTASLINKVVAVRFNEIGEIADTTYMKINNETEYPLYKANGLAPLSIENMDDCVVYFALISNKWQLVLVGVDNTGRITEDSGHTITDGDNNVLTQRKVLNFSGFDVKDDATLGATKISNPSYISTEYSGEALTVPSNTWTRLGNTIVKAPEEGLYRVNVYIEMNNISSVGKEIGIRAVDTDQTGQEDWIYQYKRCKHSFSVLIYANGTNLVLTPWIYVDPITSVSANIVDRYSFRIEKLNVK